jgi:hypothetical protein
VAISPWQTRLRVCKTQRAQGNPSTVNAWQAHLITVIRWPPAGGASCNGDKMAVALSLLSTRPILLTFFS